jgi:serine phosphatase RsbU (regulator of sigma subunit)
VEVDTGAVTGRHFADEGRFGPIEWAVAARPLPGQATSGDEAVAVEVDATAALFGVVDGLGHGPDAASAAARATEVISQHVEESLEDLIGACHRELATTRGAAMTLARIDFEANALHWVGVGNVTAALVSRGSSGLETSSFVRLANGIVGFRVPRIPAPEVVEMRPGHLLVVATDGITDDHLDALDFADSAKAIANRILGEHTRVTDDALVLVARHRGST